jgi:drug/metabolite transporter (DMT)-like permease
MARVAGRIPAVSSGRSTLAGTLIVLFAAALFGTLGVLSRTAYASGVTPFAFVAWRALVGGLGIWAFAALARTRGLPILSVRNMDRGTRVALLGSIALATVVNLAVFLAFQWTTVALVLLGFYTYPAMVAAGAVLLGRERLSRSRAAALVLSLLGMVAVVLGGQAVAVAQAPGGGPAPAAAIGIGLALVAAASNAAFVLASRGYARVPTHQAMATILTGAGSLSAVVAVAATGTESLTFPVREAGALPLLVAVGLFTAALPSALFLYGIREIGAIRTGILMLFEPPVGVVLAAIFLAETLHPVQLIGGVTILAAAVVIHRGGALEEAAGEGAIPATHATGGP